MHIAHSGNRLVSVPSWNVQIDDVVPVYAVLCAAVSSSVCAEIQMLDLCFRTTAVETGYSGKDEHVTKVEIASSLDDYELVVECGMVVVQLGEVPRLRIDLGISIE